MGWVGLVWDGSLGELKYKLSLYSANKDNVTNVLIYENIIENKSFAESQQALSHKSQS